MKLIKIAQDHYIIVDDSEIKKGDYWFDGTNIRNDYSKQIIKSFDKKITHSTKPLETLKNEYAWYGGDNKVKQKDFSKIISICLQEVKELIGEVDVEKKAEKFIGCEYKDIEDNIDQIGYDSFIRGYNQALEDNKEKKYTEEDIRDVVRLALEDAEKSVIWSKEWYPNKSADKIIQSLQPKTEWEVEFVDGRLKLKK